MKNFLKQQKLELIQKRIKQRPMKLRFITVNPVIDGRKMGEVFIHLPRLGEVRVSSHPLDVYLRDRHGITDMRVEIGIVK